MHSPDLLFHSTDKLFSILLFVVLYRKAAQIRNVFFVLATKRLVTRDVLFVGYTALLPDRKDDKTNELRVLKKWLYTCRRHKLAIRVQNKNRFKSS